MDPELSKKKEIFEKYKKSHKKKKDDRTSGFFGLANDDYNPISDRMEKLENERCKGIDERKNELVNTIMDLL